MLSSTFKDPLPRRCGLAIKLTPAVTRICITRRDAIDVPASVRATPVGTTLRPLSLRHRGTFLPSSKFPRTNWNSTLRLFTISKIYYKCKWNDRWVEIVTEWDVYIQVFSFLPHLIHTCMWALLVARSTSSIFEMNYSMHVYNLVQIFLTLQDPSRRCNNKGISIVIDLQVNWKKIANLSSARWKLNETIDELLVRCLSVRNKNSFVCAARSTMSMDSSVNYGCRAMITGSINDSTPEITRNDKPRGRE